MSEAEREKWDARYRERGSASSEPSTVLVGLDDVLPRTGRALDLAGGAGRHAIWLAKRGLDVTLADVSAAGIEIAQKAAKAAGVSLSTARVDLDTDPIPSGPYDLIVSFHYLNRRLFDAFADALAPDGMLVFVQPTVKNLERHPKPPRPFVLEEGELAKLAARTGLAVERCTEEWTDEGRHEALLIARRSSPGVS